jgi:TonB family protein
LEFELKEIRERSLAFWVLIAIFIHLAVGYGVYSYSGSPHSSDLLNVFKGKSTVEGVNSAGKEISPSIAEDDNSAPAVAVNPVNSELILPPIEPSALANSGNDDSTFIHESSGLLFADEIPIPGKQKTVEKQLIVDPQINRAFTLSNLPRQYRDREWELTLRLKVSKEGKPVGKIRVVKSSGDDVLDQLTISRVSESSFEPAHYEQSITPIDRTFDLQIHYK